MGCFVSTGSRHMKIDLVSINHYPAHWHDSLELLAVIKGSLTVKDGFEEHRLTEGDVLVVNANDLHAIDRCDDENLVILLDIDIRYFESHYPAVQNTIIVCDSNTDKVKFRKQLDVVFLSALDLYYFFSQNGEETADEEIERRGLKLLAFLIENFRYLRVYEDSFASLESNDLHAKTLGGALDYIYKNFTERITLADISASVNFSKYYISHLIRTVSGLSFQEYLNMLRAENSEKLLLTSAKSIQEIAYESGFSDVKYYNKHFTRWYHTTPGAHRRSYLAAHSAKEKQPPDNAFDFNEAIRRIQTYLTDSGYTLPQNEGSVRIEFDKAREALPGSAFRRFTEFELDLAAPAVSGSPKALLDCAKNELDLTTVRLLHAIPLHAFPHQQAAPAFRHAVFDLLAASSFHVILSLPAGEAPLRKTLQAEIDDFFSGLTTRYGADTVGKWTVDLQAEKETSALSFDSFSVLPHLLQAFTRQGGYGDSYPLKMIDSGCGKNIFTGESGLLTANGFKKAAYHFCSFLSRLGEEVLETGDAHILTKSASSWQLLLFHFPTETVPCGAAKNILLCSGDPAGSYRLVKQTINKKHGSVYDNWIRFGSPKYLSAADEALLTRASCPEIEFIQWNAGQKEIEIRLEPDTVQLIEIKKNAPR